MIIKQFTLGPIENNNYLLIEKNSQGTNEAILIDCTEYSQEIFDEIEKNNAELKYILITHGHFDHILGINDFKAKYPDAKVIAHIEDKELIENIEEFARRFGVGKVQLQKIDEYLNDGDIIEFCEKKIKLIHTPGHTKGGVCFLIDDELFTGDTLFYESVGRTDLPGGSFEQIKSSIENNLFTLPENIKVYPGHGISSTIGHEKENNRFL